MSEKYKLENIKGQEKLQKLTELCGGIPDALYLHSGVTEITEKDGEKKYKPGSYSDVDWKGFLSGGKGRALALVELATCFPNATIALNSNTYNINDPEAPTDAEVMAEYVTSKGINPERILEQDRSTTTFTELIELIKYIAKHDWKHPVVVAGGFQIPRASEMLKQIETLRDPAGEWKDPEFRMALEKIKETKPKITFVSAEDVLPLRNSRYTDLIEKAKKTETWKIRENLDNKAIEQLKAGTYWKQ